ncbi:MAG: HEAT repeat domain-containing protein, partial [Candidatus Eremiobacterota bacterium]
MTSDEIRSRLQRPRPLTRSEGAQILEHPEALSVLVEALDCPVGRYWAASLLGALGDERGLPPLLSWLRRETDFLAREMVLSALAQLGPCALEPLVEMLHGQELPRYMVMRSLFSLAARHPDAQDAVCATFVRLLTPDMPPWEGLPIVTWLDLRDRREAIPEVERWLEGNPNSLYREAHLNAWKSRERGDRFPSERMDPLDFLTGDHWGAYHQLLESLAAEDDLPEREGWVAEFEEDLRRLQVRLSMSGTAGSGPRPGRNEPCPCGSGRKYKKCCLDRDLEEGRQDPLVGLLLNAPGWPPAGHGWLPSQQWERLPRADLQAHLEILPLGPAEARRRAARETSDYLVWSCAQVQLMRGQAHEARDLAIRVSLSQ